MNDKISMRYDVPIHITESTTAAMVLCICGDVFSASGESDEVNRKLGQWHEQHKACEKQPYEAKTFWLSFCDAKRPTGQQFLGACIVDVTPAEVEDAYIEVLLQFPLAQPGSEYIAAAVKKAHALGCNPGGEVASCEIPRDNPMLALYQRGVLMDRTTIAELDALADAKE